MTQIAFVGMPGRPGGVSSCTTYAVDARVVIASIQRTSSALSGMTDALAWSVTC
jgi:hypothetical protein